MKGVFAASDLKGTLRARSSCGEKPTTPGGRNQQSLEF
jgi:hypothetical protein